MDYLVQGRWQDADRGGTLDLVLPSGDPASGAPLATGEQVTCHYWGRSVAHHLVDGPNSALLSDYLGRRIGRSDLLDAGDEPWFGAGS